MPRSWARKPICNLTLLPWVKIMSQLHRQVRVLQEHSISSMVQVPWKSSLRRASYSSQMDLTLSQTRQSQAATSRIRPTSCSVFLCLGLRLQSKVFLVKLMGHWFNQINQVAIRDTTQAMVQGRITSQWADSIQARTLRLMQIFRRLRYHLLLKPQLCYRLQAKSKINSDSLRHPCMVSQVIAVH